MNHGHQLSLPPPKKKRVRSLNNALSFKLQPKKLCKKWQTHGHIDSSESIQPKKKTYVDDLDNYPQRILYTARKKYCKRKPLRRNGSVKVKVPENHAKNRRRRKLPPTRQTV
jgi:hypothetical protein